MSTVQVPPHAGSDGGTPPQPDRRRRIVWLSVGTVLVIGVLCVLGILIEHSLDVGPAASGSTASGSTGSGPGSARQVTAAPALSRSLPERIEIPSIGVDSPIVPLGLTADGTVQVPPIAPKSPVGWYRHSPTPGETSASVLLGHKTAGTYGKSVFYRLDQVRPGTRINVIRADGSTAAFTVTRSEVYPKSRFPSDAVYGATSTPQLRLVTCAVPAGPAGSGYLDNLVVYATLTS
ncbi:class F sortase [Streptomyces sp. H27-H1]|uniref:class F sortase n=1 Tax=Streptomyces sp. H27-H1 TaxID=2996461 RepID=UPI002271351D|nr:class F sortase [Streptomyces sp. H27-H1]MCY0932130.1 class F sortase [Streptomyces sp. H27-H1]